MVSSLAVPDRRDSSPVTRAMLVLIQAYRRWLSPAKGRPTCRFLPTCSEYAAEVIRRDGAWSGGRLALWRLLRCQPFGGSGIDLP